MYVRGDASIFEPEYISAVDLFKSFLRSFVLSSNYRGSKAVKLCAFGQFLYRFFQPSYAGSIDGGHVKNG